MEINHGSRLIIILLLTPFFIASIHALLSRVLGLLCSALSTHSVVLLAITLGHIPVFLLIWFFALTAFDESGSLITALVYSIVVYEAIAYTYFHLFNMSETARRIKILLEIYRSNGLKVSGLSASYSSEEMLENRLKRLLAMRQVRFTGGRYFLNSKILYFAAVVISAWGRILGLPSPLGVYKKRDKSR